MKLNLYVYIQIIKQILAIHLSAASFRDVSFCDSNSIPSAVLDDDAGNETDVNHQANQENPKSVPVDSVCPETSHQIGGDISILSPEQVRESRAVSGFLPHGETAIEPLHVTHSRRSVS